MNSIQVTDRNFPQWKDLFDNPYNNRSEFSAEFLVHEKRNFGKIDSEIDSPSNSFKIRLTSLKKTDRLTASCLAASRALIIIGCVFLLLQEYLGSLTSVDGKLPSNTVSQIKRIVTSTQMQVLPIYLISWGIAMLLLPVVFECFDKIGKFFVWLNSKPDRTKEREKVQAICDRKWDCIVNSEKILRDRKRGKEEKSLEIENLKKSLTEKDEEIRRLERCIK